MLIKQNPYIKTKKQMKSPNLKEISFFETKM